MAYLTDGYQTLISFTLAPSVHFKEKEVQPPAIDGGGPIETTTMRNTTWRTKQPKHLFTLDDITLQVEWDTLVYSTIVTTLLNKNNTIVITFPDGHTLTVWGYLDKFTPTALKDGDFPLAELKIVPTNQDNSGNEQAPAYV